MDRRNSRRVPAPATAPAPPTNQRLKFWLIIGVVALLAFNLGLGVVFILSNRAAMPPSGSAAGPDGFAFIDLAAHYDLQADEPSQFGAWEVVPKGEQTFEGTPFKANGMIRLLGSKPPPQGTVYRERIEGIQVGQAFAKLHLLHGTGWTGTNDMPVARMVWHYADGTRREFPIIYGRHVRDWWRRTETDLVSDTNSMVVWDGQAPRTSVRLYRSTFVNPEPGKQVKALDLISAKSVATPAIVAISVEGR